MDSLDRKAGQDFLDQRARTIIPGLVNQSRRREDLRAIRVRQDTPEFLVDLASEAGSEIEGCRERREASPEGSRASRESLDFPEIKVWTDYLVSLETMAFLV